MFHEPLVCGSDPVRKRHRRPPAKVTHPADVEKLAGSAIRFGGVVNNRAGISDDIGDDLGEVANGHILTDTDVDRLRGVVVLQQEQACRREVVDMQELSARSAGPPENDLCRTALSRLVETADECRYLIKS